MKQRLNKKLVKQLRDGKIAVHNDGTEKQLQNILLCAFPNDDDKPQCNGKYYFKLECKQEWDSWNKTELKVYSVKDFFKPAKVKLKYVDKPIWFPDVETKTSYKKQLADFGGITIYSEPYDKRWISYKDIKWTKTKSSIEDRVSALEHYRKETNTILSNIVYKISSPEEQNKIDCLNGIIDAAEDIVKEVREPVSAIKVTHDVGTKPSETVHLRKDANGYITDKIQTKEKPIDWSKPQYLVSERGKVVLSTGKHSNEYFDAIKFGDENYVRRIQYVKKYYKPFKGTITV